LFESRRPPITKIKNAMPTRNSNVLLSDNLGSHKGKAIRRAIRAAGARLFFLPPYSPDLNPIEQVFAKLKHFLREAAERTAPATWRRIGTLLVHRQAEDMTAPTIKRNAAKKPLISGRRPDMTRPREVLCLADRFSSWPWGTGRAVSACRPANTDATSHTTHSCRAPGGYPQNAAAVV
jgi:DDE superfamily endonuclease